MTKNKTLDEGKNFRSRSGSAAFNIEYGADFARTYTPVEDLIIAMLTRAIQDYLGVIPEGSLDKPEETKESVMLEAHEWIFGWDQDWEMSFETVCAGLMLDADFLRKGVKKLEDLPPLERQRAGSNLARLSGLSRKDI